MTHPKVRWEEMLPHEFIAARDSFPVCWMAYGLAEPHGAYNALGLDWLKAYSLLEAAARQHGGILAPPFAWHITEVPEFHGDGKGGGWFRQADVRQPLCSSLPADLFYRIIFYQIRAMDARGFHAAILVTGHYGGIERVMRKIAEYYLRRTGSPIRLYCIADWECMDEGLPYRGDHAGVCETSQLMALRPGLTDLQRRSASAELGEKFAAGLNFEKGPTPSEQIGREIVDSQLRNLGSAAARLLEEYRPKDGWAAPDLNVVGEISDDFIRLAGASWRITWEEYRNGNRKYGVLPDWDELEQQKS